MASRRSKEEVLRIARSVPKYIRGELDDEYGLAEAFWSGFINKLLEQIHDAAVIKSAGLGDELGVSWKALSLETKAYSKPSVRAQLFLPGRRSPKQGAKTTSLRPTLTAAENQVWKTIYARSLKRTTANFLKNKNVQNLLRNDQRKFLASMNRFNAAAQRGAAKKAWNTIKSRLGAKTLLELAGSVEVPILSESGDLIESFMPTGTTPYRPGPNQAVRYMRGKAKVASTLPYAKKQMKARPFWPSDNRMNLWKGRAIAAGRASLTQKLKQIL